MKINTAHISLIILFVFCLIITACSDDKKVEVSSKSINEATTKFASNCPKHILNQKENNLNISVLIDLSDRIEGAKTKLKDSAYLASLSKAFVSHVKTKKLILLEDRMQLFFYPEPSDNKINEIAKKLKVGFTKETSKSKLEETTALYAKYPSQLYNIAQKDALKDGYPGADIWRFFKDNVQDYCISECHRNILVILTDGYMYYDKTVMKEDSKTSYLTPKSLNKLGLNNGKWQSEITKRDLGFIPAVQNLNDLEVLVIGINSLNDDNPYAQDILKHYWTDWFVKMGMRSERFKIKNADLPSSIEKVISDFILKS